MLTCVDTSELPARIASKIVVEQRSDHVETPCWVWTGLTTDGGYASAYLDGSSSLHRAVYKRMVGPITNQTLDHLCRVKTCVFPEHLEPVTYRENKRRGMADRTECKFGHPLDGVRNRPGGATSRYCLTCQARMMREHRARKKAGV
ncbi:HNH endonuclease [Rhodococcus phage Finch]|uniref:HNH endonuclease n=1 Tax=Rhodococcus phage Finch TaxID=2094144 RepID=A0A2P1JXV7_9CAUD|nr:HNH endonuclease [Rhodococcus phage Finch]AVO25179.1 HNH endonuclease [Rhodococcus phage Finch]